MGKKLKSENMQKRAVFSMGSGSEVMAGVENGAMLTTFIQIYFRMHHFVVKFSTFSSPQAARGHRPPNQNPADALGNCFRSTNLPERETRMKKHVWMPLR